MRGHSLLQGTEYLKATELLWQSLKIAFCNWVNRWAGGAPTSEPDLLHLYKESIKWPKTSRLIHMQLHFYTVETIKTQLTLLSFIKRADRHIGVQTAIKTYKISRLCSFNVSHPQTLILCPRVIAKAGTSARPAWPSEAANPCRLGWFNSVAMGTWLNKQRKTVCETQRCKVRWPCDVGGSSSSSNQTRRGKTCCVKLIKNSFDLEKPSAAETSEKTFPFVCSSLTSRAEHLADIMWCKLMLDTCIPTVIHKSHADKNRHKEWLR